MAKRRFSKRQGKKKALAGKKAVARRKTRLVRSPKKPVKVIFQCVYGLGRSKKLAQAFEALLKKEGLNDFFQASHVGMVPGKSPSKYKAAQADWAKAVKANWAAEMQQADIVISMSPRLFEIYHFELPEKVKPLYIYGPTRKGSMTERLLKSRALTKRGLSDREVFAEILRRVKRKFILKK